MKYASNNIRNILIAGHAGSGKTTLTEALWGTSGIPSGKRRKNAPNTRSRSKL